MESLESVYLERLIKDANFVNKINLKTLSNSQKITLNTKKFPNYKKFSNLLYRMQEWSSKSIMEGVCLLVTVRHKYKLLYCELQFNSI